MQHKKQDDFYESLGWVLNRLTGNTWMISLLLIRVPISLYTPGDYLYKEHTFIWISQIRWIFILLLWWLECTFPRALVACFRYVALNDLSDFGYHLVFGISTKKMQGLLLYCRTWGRAMEVKKLGRGGGDPSTTSAIHTTQGFSIVVKSMFSSAVESR